MSHSDARRRLAWSVREQALDGEAVSGDGFLVREGDFTTLVVVVDGLGHGASAHAASRTVLDSVDSEHVAERSLRDTILASHEAGRSGRGVAMAAAEFDSREDTMTWAAVGNVEGVHVSPEPTKRRARIMQQGGVVGYRLPDVKPRVIPLSSGDVVAFATDGIAEDFASHPALSPPLLSPEAIADALFRDCRIGSDDALVFVGCWQAEDRHEP